MQTEIWKVLQNVERLTDTAFRNVDILNFLEALRNKQAYQKIDQKGRSISFRETWSIHPSPWWKSFVLGKKRLSMQRCHGLWGPFGLASYLTLNGIDWIIDLLCSQDCAGKKSQPVFSLNKQSGLNWKETVKVEKDAQLCAGWWKYRWGPWEQEEVVQHSVCGRVI